MLLQKPVSRLVIVAPVLLELVAGDETIRSEAEYFFGVRWRAIMEKARGRR
jgi:hypothetical protein